MESKDEGRQLYHLCEQRLEAIIFHRPELLKSDLLTSKTVDSEASEKPLPIVDALHDVVPQYIGGISKTIKFGSAIDRLTQFYHTLSKSDQVILSVSDYSGLVIGGINFILIPMAYIAGFISGKPPKVTIGRTAQFAYSGVLFGLTLASFFIPGVSTILGLVGASLGVTAAVIAMGKLLHDRRVRKAELININASIKDKEDVIAQLEDQAKEYLQQLRALPEDDKQAIDALHQNVEVLYKQVQNDYIELEALKINRNAHLAKQGDVDSVKVLDRSVGVLLASVGVVGTIIAIFFPPAGAVILGVAAVTGFGYFVSRVSYPVVNKVFNWLKQKISPGGAVDASPEKPDLAPDSTLKITKKLQEPSNAPEASHPVSVSQSVVNQAPQSADKAKILSAELLPKSEPEPESANPSDTPVDQDQSNSEVKPPGQH